MTRLHRICIFLCASLLGLGLLAAAGWGGYQAGWWRFNYPDRDLYPVHGIDVSHHQGEIDWSKIPKDKIQFAYIKASEGGDWKDKSFARNWQEAERNGFATGAYHFFTLCKDGASQAMNFLDVLPSEDDAGAMAPAIDLEYGGNCSARPTRQRLHRELGAMIGMIQEEMGRRPILYVTTDFYRDYLAGSEFAAFPLWVRDIYGKPSLDEFPGAVLWQYAANAHIEGISGPVDLNISFLTQ